MSDHFIIKPDGSWEFKGEDSRLKDRRNQKSIRVFNPITRQYEYRIADPVYCFNCGAEGGWSARESPMIRYICDKCWDKGCWDGRFVPLLPWEEWRWRNGLPPIKDE